MTQTSFSIIITCFNQSAFILETVQSALSQTYAAKRVIVIDDASTDVSVSLLKQYGDVITLISRSKNGGASAARNLGASIADGDYLVFLDGDDVLVPWALELYARLIAVKEPPVILGSLLYFQGPTVLRSSFYFRDKLVDNHEAVPSKIAIVEYDYLMNKDRPYRACVSAFVVERRAFEKINGWTKEIFPMEDTDFLLKLGYSGRAIQIDSPPTVCYRVHAGSTMRQMVRWLPMACRLIERTKSGVYTVKGQSLLGAYAFLGGAIFFQLKRALKARLYVGALELFFRGIPLIVVAALRRLQVVIMGRRPIEVLPGLCCAPENPEISALTREPVDS